jgi:HlyD family secretion protein
VKKLFVLLVLIGLGLAGTAFWLNQKTSAVTLPPRHERADKGPIVEEVNSTGKLIFKDINVVATVYPGGRIVEIYPEAEVSKKVTKGTPLLKLDDELVKAQNEEAQSALRAAESLLPQAEAEREEVNSTIKAAEALEQSAHAKRETAEAQVRVKNAQLEYALKERERAQKVFDGGDLTKDKLESAEKAVKLAREDICAAETQVKEADAGILLAKANLQKTKAGLAKVEAASEGAKAKIQQAKTAVTKAQLALNMTVVKAPVDGVILEKKVVKGQMIAPEATPVLFTLAPDLNRMELRAQVGESDIGKIHKGMAVTFTVDAYTDEASTFEGDVRLIPEVPTLIPSREGLPAIAGPVFYTVNIDVKPRATNLPARSLRAGYTANIKFIIKKVENVLRVPTAALNYVPDPLDPADKKLISEKAASNWKPLWTWSAGEPPHLVFVRTGANDGTKTEINEVAEGGKLTEGTEVIIEGPPSPEAGKGLFDTPTRIRI